MNTLNIIFEDTGLTFFDEDPFSEYSIHEPWPFSYQSIMELARQWDKAEPMLDELDRYLKLVVEQPQIIATVLDVIRRSLVSERQPR